MTRELRDRVLERLGFTQAPPPDLAGLRALYLAWCMRVPFDNVRKMIALRAGGGHPLPGVFAAEFFESWLEHTAGGTCWPTSNALFELLMQIGFEARRKTGCMRDLGMVNHAGVTVRLESRDWLVDTSMMVNVPLPLDDRLFVITDPVFPAEVEFESSSHVVWYDTPPNSSYYPCRYLSGEVDQAYYVAAYERSRERSPFNQRLYARRNRPGELVVLVGNTRFCKTAHGLTRRDLSAREVCNTLRDEIGISDVLIDEWAQSGALDASLLPPDGPKPPPVTRKPPSQR